MTASTIQFITKTRLAELSRQRESLIQQYDAAENSGHGDSLSALAQLYDGLTKVHITGTPLHRELPNLKAMFHAHAAPPSLIDFYRQRLLQEIKRGRLRANLVYLFGAVLSEWDATDSQGVGRLVQREAEKVRTLAELAAPATAPPLEILNEALTSLADYRAKVHTTIAKRLAMSLNLELGCYYGLESISNNLHHPPQVRLEAKQFLADHDLAEQLTNAIRVATRDPRSWFWPGEGVKPRVLWTRHRWRLYPTLSLVELLSLQHTEEFWSGGLDQCYTDSAIILNRRSRLQKLIDLEAPEVIIANERGMLNDHKQRRSFDWYEPVDPWTNALVITEDDEEPVVGIVGKRALRQAELREPKILGYGYGEGSHPMVQLVHAEVELLRAAYPDQPLYVLKLDVREYFATVPHETLLTLLRGLGMTEDGLQFTQRYLQTPYQTDAELAVAKRGVPMELPYSHWLCELLMRLFERTIHSRAKVRIIRQIDDLCLLARDGQEIITAYAVAKQFLTDVGLSLNDDKSGSVTIGGASLAELPAQSPRWGVLELTSSGQWQVNQSAYADYLSVSRAEVEARQAVLGKVLAYNDQLKHLLWGLGLAMDLGDAHRASANAALQSFENGFFENGQSIFAGLQSLIEQRYSGQVHDLPLSWMLWPITAGGLGLRSATVLSGQYEMAFQTRRLSRVAAPTDRAENWQAIANQWSKFYDDKFTKLEPANCDESPTMKALVEGFIRRGQSISSGQQSGLSPYWRWTLSIFGPEILDRLGNFEFLLTELVPLHLIHDKLLNSDLPTE